MGLSWSWESRHHTREHTEYTVSGGMGEAPEQNGSAITMGEGTNDTRRPPKMSSTSTYRQRSDQSEWER